MGGVDPGSRVGASSRSGSGRPPAGVPMRRTGILVQQYGPLRRDDRRIGRGAGATRTVSKARLNLARKGDPNHSGLPKWPAFTAEKCPAMIFNCKCETRLNPDTNEHGAGLSYGSSGFINSSQAFVAGNHLPSYCAPWFMLKLFSLKRSSPLPGKYTAPRPEAGS